MFFKGVQFETVPFCGVFTLAEFEGEVDGFCTDWCGEQSVPIASNETFSETSTRRTITMSNFLSRLKALGSAYNE